MKRHGQLYPKITTKENIYQAYRSARKGKSWQDTIKRFESNLDGNLYRIKKSLEDKTFTTSEYSVFTIYEPKERQIYRLPFNPDRVVQHALMNILEPIWTNLFIHDSYSCIKGRGIHKGSKRLMSFIRRCGKDCYCLKLDISKFYPSIDHDILYQIVKRKIKCRDTLWLLKNIIYSLPGGCNVPIGNYTSQWFGNLYMNELDQFLKHEHQVQFYMRYCDDFLIIHQDKKYLHYLRREIEQFLWDKLKLTLSRAAVFPVGQGIDFLGYRHFPGYILLRKRTVKRFRKRCKELPKEYSDGRIDRGQYRSSLASMEGWLKWCNGYNLTEKLAIKTQWEKVHGAQV